MLRAYHTTANRGAGVRENDLKKLFAHDDFGDGKLAKPANLPTGQRVM